MVQIKDIVDVLQAELIGHNVSFDSISTDTRTIKKNSLFFALSGPNFDGHDFIKIAEEKEAAAAVVTRPIECDIPLLQVDDVFDALGRFGAHHRSLFDIPVVAVTGSCGKTTTKTMIAHILQQNAKILSTQGTMNNHIGCPLTLLRLQKDHEYAVIEMGASGPGDIQYLCELVKPTVSLVTNIAAAHLEGFGSLKGVATAKSEIYQGLSPQGVAILNADDAFSDLMASQIRTDNTVRFGVQNPAEIQARNIQLDAQCRPEFTLVTPQGQAEIRLPLVGEHNVMNALAASAVCYVLGISLDTIQRGLASLQPIDMRLVHYSGLKGSMVFDDTYNANPLSFDAALHVLSMTKGPKCLVVGDMAELGDKAVEFHREIGAKAKNLGVDRLYAIGELSQEAALAFGENGCCYASYDALIDDVKDALGPNVAVLIKGSRKAQMETVVKAIVEPSPA